MSQQDQPLSSRMREAECVLSQSINTMQQGDAKRLIQPGAIRGKGGIFNPWIFTGKSVWVSETLVLFLI